MSEVESHPDDVDQVLESAIKSITAGAKKKGKSTTTTDKPTKKKAKIVKEKDPLVKLFEDDHENYCAVHTEDIPRLRTWTCTPSGSDMMTFNLDFGGSIPVKFCVPKANAASVRKSIQNIRRKYFPVINNGEEHVEEHHEAPVRETLQSKKEDTRKRKLGDADSDTSSDSESDKE